MTDKPDGKRWAWATFAALAIFVSGPSIALIIFVCEAPPVTLTNTSTAPELASPEGFTAFLENRWPVYVLRKHCKADRLEGSVQLLVTRVDEQLWKGILHRGADTGIDRVWWYGKLANGRVASFCLRAKSTFPLDRRRSYDRYWLLEQGEVGDLVEPPRW
jgi:hypothetical protein